MPGRELDLLAKYPRGKRDPAARAKEKTLEDIAIARQFGREFFDGERRHGYGGYSASPERWKGVVADLIDQYDAYWTGFSVLDVGCAKGGLVQALNYLDILAAGIDVSRYAIENAPRAAKPHVIIGCATNLPWGPKSFNLVISINTIHNLDRAGVIQALQEIERVGKRAYVTVDTYRNEEERQRMFDWNLTAQTILHVNEWLELFKEAGYTGDYGWFVP